jgi:hypothetical protein
MKIRLYGTALLIVSLAGFHWLSHGFAVAGVQHSTLLEIAVAAICVPAWLFGLPMMAMGSGLFARTDIPPPSGEPARDLHRTTKEGDDASSDPSVF